MNESDLGTLQTLFRALFGHYMDWFFADSYWWTVFGFIGTFTFGARFVVQWWVSEKNKKVVVPPLFWYLSFIGSCITLIYVMHVDKMPLILGNCFLPFLYARNLILLRRQNLSQS